jgi:hypothetical protein
LPIFIGEMLLNDSELQVHNDRMRARECRIAAAALFSACTMSIIRALILPWLISVAPPNTFPGMDAHAIQIVSFCTAGLFVVLAMWATKDPLPPSLAALVFYAAMSIPDLANQPGFLAKGIISKLIMLTILLRAIASGLVHRSFSSK